MGYKEPSLNFELRYEHLLRGVIWNEISFTIITTCYSHFRGWCGYLQANPATTTTGSVYLNIKFKKHLDLLKTVEACELDLKKLRLCCDEQSLET